MIATAGGYWLWRGRSAVERVDCELCVVHVGSWLAVVRGYQSGGEGAVVAMPSLSPRDRNGLSGYASVSRRQLRFCQNLCQISPRGTSKG